MLVLLRRVSRCRAAVMRFKSCVLVKAGLREAMGLLRKVSKGAVRWSNCNVTGGDGVACWPGWVGVPRWARAPLRGGTPFYSDGVGVEWVSVGLALVSMPDTCAKVYREVVRRLPQCLGFL